MLVIYVVIPFFGYLWFIRLNELIAEKRFRVNYGMWRWLEMFPHKKKGMWRWKEYWWIEVPTIFFCIIVIFFSMQKFLWVTPTNSSQSQTVSKYPPLNSSQSDTTPSNSHFLVKSSQYAQIMFNINIIVHYSIIRWYCLLYTWQIYYYVI